LVKDYLDTFSEGDLVPLEYFIKLNASYNVSNIVFLNLVETCDRLLVRCLVVYENGFTRIELTPWTWFSQKDD